MTPQRFHVGIGFSGRLSPFSHPLFVLSVFAIFTAVSTLDLGSRLKGSSVFCVRCQGYHFSHFFPIFQLVCLCAFSVPACVCAERQEVARCSMVCCECKTVKSPLHPGVLQVSPGFLRHTLSASTSHTHTYTRLHPLHSSLFFCLFISLSVFHKTKTFISSPLCFSFPERTSLSDVKDRHSTLRY